MGLTSAVEGGAPTLGLWQCIPHVALKREESQSFPHPDLSKVPEPPQV